VNIRTDYFGISFPRDFEDSLHESVSAVLDAAGATALPCASPLYGLGDRGTVKFDRRGVVGTMGVSGRALSHLRSTGLLGAFLMELGSYPVRVTMIHICHDRFEPAAPYIHAAYSGACDGSLRLGRKRLGPDDVELRLSPRDGENTGTVYIGSPRAKLRICLYDKRHERLNKSFPDPGPWVRLELRSKTPGVTLRDVFDPVALFWHLVPDGMLPAYTGPAWVPHGEKIHLESRPILLPAERLKRRIESSTDLTELCKLATMIGPSGRDYLVSLVKKRFDVLLAASSADPLRQRKTA